MMRQIDVSVDVFAAIWAARRENEKNENEILSRLLGLNLTKGSHSKESTIEINNVAVRNSLSEEDNDNLPTSKKWTDVLIWTLCELGGKATLGQIYSKSREGRAALGYKITENHDASARECLESHCHQSSKFRHKADLFYMPEGKGAGVWALR